MGSRSVWVKICSFRSLIHFRLDGQVENDNLSSTAGAQTRIRHIQRDQAIYFSSSFGAGSFVAERNSRMVAPNA